MLLTRSVQQLHQLRKQRNMKCLMNIMSTSPLPGTAWHHMTVIDPDTPKYGKAWSQVLLRYATPATQANLGEFLVGLYTGLNKIPG